MSLDLNSTPSNPVNPANSTEFLASKRQPVVAIIGPTAVGKTGLSLHIARELDAEIISVDSRQVFRYMDIGTDKVSLAVRREIPHHMIDVADPDEPFSVSDFVDGAVAAVERIIKRGRVPLFVGGTPFYYNALFHASMNAELPHDPVVRQHYEDMAVREGAAALHGRLMAADPVTAGRLHPNDVRRVSRALELWELTGRQPSQLFSESEKLDFGFDILYIGLIRPRRQLFDRIELRLEEQFASGCPNEIAWLIEHGFDERYSAMQGLVYRELAAWYRGQMSLREAVENSVTRTRAFSRRQMTWFRKFQPTLWYDVSSLELNLKKSELSHAIIQAIREHLKKTEHFVQDNYPDNSGKHARLNLKPEELQTLWAGKM